MSMGTLAAPMQRAARTLGPRDVRVKVLLLACLGAAAVIVDGWWKLAILLGASAAWAAVVAVRPTPRRTGVLVWVGIGIGGLALALWACGLPVRPYAGPVVRLVVLLVAGRAFALSTSPAEWRRALGRARLPNRLVLLLAAAHTLMGVLASEVGLARDGMRIRSAAAADSAETSRLRRMWRAGVAFCARLFARADRLAAVAETRAFSRPGRRWNRQTVGLSVGDLVAGASCVAAAAVLCLV